ncbi:PhoH family protein [Parvularcula sp. IMCC14364]|uniref:PhoH family protein n=1 Tax=Parvularcula sp. IMCC14364 TaxID=3067902 RepID=UPI002742171C|nr:PhoH family protein [Parvularcula sp. IMCC14364]
MAKRATRKSAKRLARETFESGDYNGGNIHPLFNADEWSPVEESYGKKRGPEKHEQRDQKYRKNIKAQNESQQQFMDALDDHSLVIASGPAGTGKTYVAVAKAVEALEQGHVSRIVLSRPAVEAGESLGFLPGDMEEKLSPYLRPLFDALSDRLSTKRLKTLMAENIIEIAPIAYMRGRTLNNAYVVIDEAQNCTYVQLKMLLTRLGWHSTMVITGDPQQSDLLPGISGLDDIATKLDQLDNVKVINFKDKDVVRHPLVAEMLGVL